MYAKRIQLSNYGPIEQLDISFPFLDATPQPVLLVGENGSGKTILLSHIINGLMTAKDLTYPDTPEVTEGKVYKVRSPTYIRAGNQHYFGRVDFEDDHYVSELHLRDRRDSYEQMPAQLQELSATALWQKAKPHQYSVQDFSFGPSEERLESVKELIRQRCVLYFPSDRFEEPAWLNELHLIDKPQRTYTHPYEGQTDRRMLAISPLKDNQNWLYDVVTDQSIYDLQTELAQIPSGETGRHRFVRLFRGYSGAATNAYNQAVQLLRLVVQDPQARFGLGARPWRTMSIYSQEVESVPNVFQLSSGESSLLNLGLSILRDADMSNSNPIQASDISGIVIIDEVDLHLHTVHQHEVLPSLLKMFPKVQFIVTTHSPMLILGMEREFGDDGFSLYRLPEGVQVNPEEFTEFGRAYATFKESRAFGRDMRKAIRESTKSIVVVEGKTDKAYIERATELLGKGHVIQNLELMDGGGAPKLQTLWGSLEKMPLSIIDKSVLVLFDCDAQRPPSDKGTFHRRTIPFQSDNPIKNGIENLVGRSILERAISEKPALIDVQGEHQVTTRGQVRRVPAEWRVNRNEKTNLCQWICENGTAEDFAGFEVLLELIDEVMNRKSNN